MLLNSVRFSTATTSTGAVTPTAAVAKYLSMSEAGAVSGQQYSYRIEEGNDFEIGIGTWNGTTLSRDTVTVSKIGGTAGTSKMNLAGAAEVAIVARVTDITTPGKTLGLAMMYG